MILISINIRGLGGDIKWKYLKELLNNEQSTFVCIQETKLVHISEERCFALWRSNQICWKHGGIDKEGGGLLTMWNNQVFSCTG